MPKTSGGVFIRGGCLFILLLYNSLHAFSELSSQMLGRPILARQASFCLYRPSALPIAQLFADMPFGIPRITIFVIIIYFLSGLRLTASAFWTNWLIVLVSYYAFKGLFNFFGVVTRNFYGAARLAAWVTSLLIGDEFVH